jgi:predicted AAA+ superfamily ATPase
LTAIFILPASEKSLKDDYEVDFIAQKSGERLYIQVCYILSDKKVRSRQVKLCAFFS